MTRARRPAGLAAVLLAAFVAAAAAASRAPLPGRVILVTIDTLRADRLPMYGYPRQTAPFLSALAAAGVTYDKVYAASSHTGPCHASLFTSLYPDQHGLLENGQPLDVDGPTLASEFAARGYKTAAFVSVGFLREVMRGFDVKGVPENVSTQKPRRADRTVDAAIAWANAQPSDEKIFVWVHLYDVHNSAMEDGEDFSEWARRIETAPGAPPSQDVTRYWVEREGISRSALAKSRLALQEASYDARIRFVDEQLRRLHADVSGPDDPPSLWIVTADHGEGLGSHGHLGHGPWIYEEQTRIPLIAAFSDGRNAGARVSGIIRQVDVMPSLCAALGAPVDKRWEGRPVWPFGRKKGFKQAFITRRPQSEQDEGNTRIRSERRYALRETRWKLIWSPGGEADELYDLKRDPLEKENLATRFPRRDRALRRRLMAIVRRVTPANGAPPAPIEPANVEELKSLGYLQ